MSSDRPVSYLDSDLILPPVPPHPSHANLSCYPTYFDKYVTSSLHLPTMPSKARRAQRKKNLLKLYFKFRKQHARQLKRRTAFLRRVLGQGIGSSRESTPPRLDLDFDMSGGMASDSSSSSEWSDLFAESPLDSSAYTTSEDSSDSDDEAMPHLLPVIMDDSDTDSDLSDSESDGSEGNESDSDSMDGMGYFGDEEDWTLEDGLAGSDNESDGETAGIPPLSSIARLGRYVHHSISAMYANRYEVPRTHIPRPPSTLRFVLEVWKTERPDFFRRELRVTPTTFDSMVERLQDDPVFTNKSENMQMPVKHQLAITLYRFGHDGNAASLDSVATWSGYGKGTIPLVTRRVMTAILRRDFIDESISFPTDEEKRKAKEWVAAHSCEAWRHGWCMVDGTLVPLFNRPYWYGQSYYDRKCSYSLNIQVRDSLSLDLRKANSPECQDCLHA
jgi:hypothetical protein